MQPCSFLSTLHAACGSLPPLRQLCRCPAGTQRAERLPVVFYIRTLLFLCVTQRIIPQDRNVCARAWDTTLLPDTQGFHTNWKNFKNILTFSGSPRTSKSAQESPKQGENNILSQLARRLERDNILLFFPSVFHHGSGIIEARRQRAWEWLARADTDAGCAGRMHSPAGPRGLKAPQRFVNVEKNFPECNNLPLLCIKKYSKIFLCFTYKISRENICLNQTKRILFA